VHRRSCRSCHGREKEAGSGGWDSVPGGGEEKTEGRADSSLRSEEPVLLPAVPEVVEAIRSTPIYEPQKETAATTF
jgi:hypothetical protein